MEEDKTKYRIGTVKWSEYDTLSDVAVTGDYNDLTDKPDKLSDFTNDVGYITDVEWNDVQDKPSFSNVAFSGNYNDLANKPYIPEAQINTDWDASTGKSAILNKPTIGDGTVTIMQDNVSKGSFSMNQTGDTTITLTSSVSWNDITGKPTFATVATSGSYNDLLNTPTIPDVSGKEDTSNKVVSLSSSSTNTQYPSAKCVYDAIKELFFYIEISSSNTTDVTWNNLYEAYSNNANIVAKIDYVQGVTIVPVTVPLYLAIGNQSGGTFMFTFIMGTSAINYMVTGTGNNVCTITKEEKTVEVTDNKVQSVTANKLNTDKYPSAKAVFDEFQRKPVVVWEETAPSNYLKAIQADLSASPAWQLTNLNLTPYKRIKIYTCAGRKTSGIGVDASTTPAVILEMSLDARAAIAEYGGNYCASIEFQKPNDANRFATLTCAVSADKTSFVVLRQTNIYGTAATANDDANANVFMIEGYYD